MISQTNKILTRSAVSSRDSLLNSFINNKPTSTGKSSIKHVLLIEKRLQSSGRPDKALQKPRKILTLKNALTSAVIGTTAAVIIAKNDEDFREWTKEHLPSLDNLVKVVYQEEETYPEFISRKHKELSEWIKNVLHDAFQQRQPVKRGKPLEKSDDDCKKPYKAPASPFAVKEEETKEDNGATKPPALPRNLQELKSLEEKLVKTAEQTIQSYCAVTSAIKDHANAIENLEQLLTKRDPKDWEKLRRKKIDQQRNFERAESGLQKLAHYTDAINARLKDDTSMEDDVKNKVKNNLVIVLRDVKKAKETMEMEKEKNILAKRSWDKAKQARMHFSNELEILFPNVWLNDEKLNISVDSFEPFIQYIFKTMKFLDEELARTQTLNDAALTLALEKFYADNQNYDDLMNAAVDFLYENTRRSLQDQLHKNLLTHKAKCEKNAKALMKQHKEVYADLTEEALRMKEREVERKMQQRQEERLAEVRAAYKMEIAKMVGRIQGANEAIAQRGDKEKQQQENQRFWSATQSLFSAVSPIGVTQQEPKPLKNEINSVIASAPKDDELVENVIKTIPPAAVEKGIQSEKALKLRFFKVEKEVRKIAALPSRELTLVHLFLARLQSALYLDEAIPQEELAGEPIDVDALNNYEIIHRARYCVDRSEFDQAVRYLNLLKGPSSNVASDWVKDVLAYLETKQAAEVLLAHASTANMASND